MEQISGKQVIVDGILTGADRFLFPYNKPILYEVIRVKNGHLLFPEDHFNRLCQSAVMSGIPCGAFQNLLHDLKKLVGANSISNGNIKVVVWQQKKTVHSACFGIPSFYPEPRDYKFGVNVMTFPFERPDPNIKRWNAEFRRRVNTFIGQNNIYEALLVDEEGYITEGSRSNVFFIDSDNAVSTAPKKQVLEGITRKKVMSICEALKIPVIEKPLNISMLPSIKASFLTGTSPMILPIRKINRFSYSSDHSIVLRIINDYGKLVDMQ